MSLISNHIASTNIMSLESIVKEQSNQLQQLSDLYSQNEREFDQMTKQNAIISYNEITKRYRFEIQKPENDIYVYQLWKKDNENLNGDRQYFYEKLIEWVNQFKISNVKDKFTPTTLIRFNNNYYPTVLVSADVETTEGIEYCVFYFEDKTINPSREVIIEEMPKTGLYNNIRFDIDAESLTSYTIPGNFSPFIGEWIFRYPDGDKISLTITDNSMIQKWEAPYRGKQYIITKNVFCTLIYSNSIQDPSTNPNYISYYVYAWVNFLGEVNSNGQKKYKKIKIFKYPLMNDPAQNLFLQIFDDVIGNKNAYGDYSTYRKI